MIGNRNARYELKPGKYQVKAIFRTRTRGDDYRWSQPFELETNPVEVTVTGSEEPLPQWVRTRPLVLERLPADVTQDPARRRPAGHRSAPHAAHTQLRAIHMEPTGRLCDAGW
jgi:hypothetical protein